MTDTNTPEDPAVGPRAAHGSTVILPAEHFDYVFALARAAVDKATVSRVLLHRHLDTIWAGTTREGAAAGQQDDDRFSSDRLKEIASDGGLDPIARQIAEQLLSLPLAVRGPMWQQARAYAAGGASILAWLTSKVRMHLIDSLFGGPTTEARS